MSATTPARSIAPLRPFRPAPTHLAATVLAACLALLPPLAQADEPTLDVAPSGWTGSGELGYASARGNSSNDNFNARLHAEYRDGDWTHALDVFGLNSSAEFTNTHDDGTVDESRKTTANRYTASANSAFRTPSQSRVTSSLRYEQDDFATYDWQQSIAIGYGNKLVDGERAQLDVQVGPGYRRAHKAVTEVTEAGFIGRGYVGFKYAITDNTEFQNTLLVESGEYNTFAQNDLGVSVAMNSNLALKAGLQARHNSEVDDDIKKTDTLTTMNVVYRFK